MLPCSKRVMVEVVYVVVVCSDVLIVAVVVDVVSVVIVVVRVMVVVGVDVVVDSRRSPRCRHSPSRGARCCHRRSGCRNCGRSCGECI